MVKVIFEAEDLSEARSIMDFLDTRNAAPAATKSTAAISTTPENREPPAETEVLVDDHGMPWDEALHASTKTKNADGSWKAKKGQADAAKAALAEFKSRGGAEAAPAPTTAETPTAGLPAGAPTPTPAAGLPGAAAGGLPGAAAAAPAARTAPAYAQIEEKIVSMMGRGVLPDDAYYNLLVKHGLNTENPTPQLEADGDLRIAVWDDLVAKEG